MTREKKKWKKEEEGRIRAQHVLTQSVKGEGKVVLRWLVEYFTDLTFNNFEEHHNSHFSKLSTTQTFRSSN